MKNFFMVMLLVLGTLLFADQIKSFHYVSEETDDFIIMYSPSVDNLVIVMDGVSYNFIPVWGNNQEFYWDCNGKYTLTYSTDGVAVYITEYGSNRVSCFVYWSFEYINVS